MFEDTRYVEHRDTEPHVTARLIIDVCGAPNVFPHNAPRISWATPLQPRCITVVQSIHTLTLSV